MSKILKILSYCMIIMALFTSCSENKEGKSTDKIEKMNKEKITVYCENGLYDLLQEPFHMYDSVYNDIEVTVVKTTAREAMALLLAGKAKTIIVARDYLHDEDSLMKIYKVQPHPRMNFDEDALVFYTRKDFPLDTLNATQLTDIFTKEKVELIKLYPNLKKEPVFACNDHRSSEYANLIKLVADGKEIKKKLKFFDSPDSVKAFIKVSPNSIGIGYFSQVVKDTNFKVLSIGYTDSTGKYIFPHTVHQANIVQSFYPYIIDGFVYLLEDIKNTPWWFAVFLSKETMVQRYFLDAGIVPAYAKITLREE